MPAEQPLLEAGTPSCAQHGATLSAVSFVGADDGAPRRPSRGRAARWAGCAALATLAATALLGGAGGGARGALAARLARWRGDAAEAGAIVGHPRGLPTTESRSAARRTRPSTARGTAPRAPT